MPAINVMCPNPACQRTLRVEDKFIGVKVKCMFCNQPLLIEVQDEPVPAPPDLSTMDLGRADSVFEQQTVAGGAPPAAPLPQPVAPTLPPPAAPAPPAAPPRPKSPTRSAPAPEWPDISSSGPPPLPPRPPEGPRLKVGALIISLLSLAVICGSVAGIITLRRPAATKDETTTVAVSADKHAAIALESGGVRLVISPIHRTAEAYDLGDLVLENKEVPLGVRPGDTALNPDNVRQAMRDVGEFVQACKKQGVPESQLVVVCNSGVLRALEKDKAALEQARAALEQGVKHAGGGALNYLTADEEARFGSLGCVPPEDRTTSVLLDLGNSGAKCGYHEADGGFTGFGVPIGRGPFTAAVNEVRQRPGKFPPPKKGPGMPTAQRPFAVVAEELRPSHLNAPLKRAGSDRPALVNRKKYHLIGGVSWAAAVLTHPTDLDRRRVPLTGKDIQNFDNLVSTSPSLEALRAKVLAPIPAGPAKERATKEVGLVAADRFGLEPLIASAKILRSLSDECDFWNKNVQFFTNGLYAWPLGYLLFRSGVEK
jgi:hypothetical protein